VSWGFPRIAKYALGGAVFLVLLLAALIVWLVRRLLLRYQFLPRLSK